MDGRGTMFDGVDKAAEIAVENTPGEMKPERLWSTPEEELRLALRPDPLKKHDTHWINPRMSSVYVLTNSANSLVKIGCADNLPHRYSGLNTGSPVALHLVYAIFLLGGLLTRRVEKEAHEALTAHRVRGEWFDVPVDKAAAAIGESIGRNRFAYWTENERRLIGHYAARLRSSWVRQAFKQAVK